MKRTLYRMQNIVEVMGDSAGELTYGFHLLDLAQCVFRARQALLATHPFSYVVNELISPHLAALLVVEGVEFHLVVPPVSLRITELAHGGEFFAGERPAPDDCHGRAMLGLALQYIQHAGPNFGPDPIDGLKFVG